MLAWTAPGREASTRMTLASNPLALFVGDGIFMSSGGPRCWRAEMAAALVALAAGFGVGAALADCFAFFAAGLAGGVLGAGLEDLR